MDNSKDVYLKLRKSIRLLRLNGSHNDLVLEELSNIEIDKLERELANRIDNYMADRYRIHNTKNKK